MKRFFAFGCSYTNYHWPTWADFIANSPAFDDSYNFGTTGAGNLQIASKVFNASHLHKFTADDMVIVCWSTVTREDRSTNMTWKSGGNVFNNGWYDEEFLMKHWDMNDGLNKSMLMIGLTHAYLKQLGVPVHFTTMMGTANMFDEYKSDCVTQYDDNLLALVANVMQGIPFLEGITDVSPKSTATAGPLLKYRRGSEYPNDHHPQPQVHLDWVRRNFPEYVTPETESMADEYQKFLHSGVTVHECKTKWNADRRNVMMSRKLDTNHIMLGRRL